MYSYLLIDADNTLFDFDQNNYRALRRTCELNGLPFSEETHALYSRINDQMWHEFEKGIRTKESVLVERFRLFGEALSIPVDPVKCTTDHEAGLAMPPVMIKDAEEVCRYLSQKYELYLVTNAVEHVQRSRFAHSPLPPYFKDVFISEAIGYGKPDPRFFEYVFAHIPGITRENCLLVGDGLGSDIRGANNFSIPCCWFNLKDQQLPDDLHADYIIKELADLYRIL